MDDPLDIVNAAIDQHTKMVKQMKGVPGMYVSKIHCKVFMSGEECIA